MTSRRRFGYCRQCDEAISQAIGAKGDFYLTSGRDGLEIDCPSCGPTTVNKLGDCITDCRLHHVPPPGKRWLNWARRQRD